MSRMLTRDDVSGLNADPGVGFQLHVHVRVGGHLVLEACLLHLPHGRTRKIISVRVTSATNEVWYF